MPFKPRTVVLEDRVLTIQPGTKIGKYVIQDEIGAGASGMVFTALQDVIHRTVALKILNPAAMQPMPGQEVAEQIKKTIGRFLLEAKLPAFLVHPNIVPIFDIGEENQLNYYTMQYIEGTALRKFPVVSLNILQKLDIFLQICNAVSYAHKFNIIHRDLKPQNIMITSELTAIVVDFGIGKVLGERADQLAAAAMSAPAGEYRAFTDVNVILGTPAYMPPEQVISYAHRQNRLKAGKPAYEMGLYSDVFALGVILYELLTQQRPFPNFPNARQAWVDRVDYLDNPKKHPIPPIESFNPSLPADLNDILLKCLQPIPTNRYSTAKELWQAVYDFTARYKTQHPQEYSYSLIKTAKLEREPSRWPSVLVALFLFLCLLAASVVVYYEKLPPTFEPIKKYQQETSDWIKQKWDQWIQDRK